MPHKIGGRVDRLARMILDFAKQGCVSGDPADFQVDDNFFGPFYLLPLNVKFQVDLQL